MAETRCPTKEPLGSGYASELLRAVEDQFGWYQQEVRKFVVRRFKDYYDVDALTSEAMYLLLQSLKRLETTGELVSNMRWLMFLAARDACKAPLRKQKRRRKSGFELVPLVLEQKATNLDPEQSTLSRERQELIRHAVNVLPICEAKVFYLRRIYEYSVEETASMLQIPIGTVKSRLSSTDIKLRKPLSSLYRDITGSEVCK